MLCYHTSEMSCPYFDPLKPHPREGAAPLAHMPLGGTWSGACHADPRQPVAPEESALYRLCNLGYARGQCPRFPVEDPGPDAARFTLSSDDGATLRIYYVLERDHQPFAHGPLEFAVGERTFAAAPAGSLTARQAAAYAASYLERKCAALEK